MKISPDLFINLSMLKFLLSIVSAFAVFGLQSQTLNYYYGNLHAHTDYSDGNQDKATSGVSTPSASYEYAKLSNHMDFLGISEHNHYSGGSVGMKVQNYTLGIAQASAATTGTFLAMYGMEWGVSSVTYSGHLIIYGFDQLIGWETESWGPNYTIYNDKLDYNGIFTKVRNNPNAFCTLAHPSNTDYSNLSNSPKSLTYDSAIVGSVFRNGPAFSTSTNYYDFASGDYFGYYKKMLSKGYHIGISYDHDNHNTTFGRVNAGRLVVMAPALNVTDFTNAMKNMHFYASDDWNCKMDFKINTSIIGDSTSGITYPTINVSHNDMDGELADSIKIWSGVEGSGSYATVIKAVKYTNTLSYTDNAIAPGSNRYYFIEVIQNDGDRIITSPIWYKVSNIISVEEYKKDVSIVMFPNPVNDVLYISTNLNDKYTVELFDVSGKCVMTEHYDTGDIRISTDKFESGFYSIKISSDKFSRVQKLIIE